MFKVVAGFSLLVSVSAIFADAPREPSVSITCTGRLRDGVVAIGGETTGTTLSSKHVTWELRLIRESDRAFARQNNKETVTVVGIVQRVAGVERPARWIVDVHELQAAERDVAHPHTRIKVVGRVQSTGDRCGDGFEIAIRVGEQRWPLAFEDESGLKAVAETSIGLTVELTGVLESATREDHCAPGSIRVLTLDPS